MPYILHKKIKDTLLIFTRYKQEKKICSDIGCDIA